MNKKCKRTDLEQERSMTEYWTFNDEGMPEYFKGDGDMSEFMTYHCDNCDEYFDLVAEALAHVGKVVEGGE